MRARGTRQAGFTLIEVLVVLVIIGVVVTFATLSVNPSGPSDRLEQQSQRLFALAQTAADQAILSGQTIGLQLADHGYRFVVLSPKGWQPITSSDSPLRPHRLDDDLYLDRIGAKDNHDAGDDQAGTLALPVSPAGAADPGDPDAGKRDGDNAGQALAVPAALFLSSGELLPFTLELSAKGVDHRFDITGAPNGDIQRRRVDR